jgi:acetoacetate decarboxylase
VSYPPPPWQLRGPVVVALRRVAIARVRALVPQGLSIVPVWPGETLGAIYFANYGPGSPLCYRELIVAPALVRRGLRLGGFVTHIYVDDPDSLAGGREIWGLPKTLARFSWPQNDDGTCTVDDGAQRLCAMTWGRWTGTVPGALWLPSLSTRAGTALSFQSWLRGRLCVGRGRLDAPRSSPVASLGLTTSGRLLRIRDAHITVAAPRVLGALPGARGDDV